MARYYSVDDVIARMDLEDDDDMSEDEFEGYIDEEGDNDGNGEDGGGMNGEGMMV